MPQSSRTRSIMSNDQVRAERRTVCCPALVHHDGRFQKAMIVDFMVDGLGLNNTFGLAVGQRVAVEVLTGHYLDGKVAWSLGSRAGIRLSRSMSVHDPTYLRLVTMAKGSLALLPVRPRP
jgi:hypothetical protein